MNKKRCVLLGLLFLITLPVVIAALYSFPSADDFSNSINLQGAQGSTFVARIVNHCIEVHNTWQGTYFGNAFCFAGIAVHRKMGIIGIRIEFIATIVLFVWAIWFVLFRLINTFGFNRKDSIDHALLSTVVTLLIVFDNYNISEVFLWHTGLSMYTVPLSLGLGAIGIMLRQQVSARDTIIACILAFCAVGGALDISAFVCGSLCLLAFNTYRLRDKQHIRTMVVFVCALIGALLNAAAPGNYSRAATMWDGVVVSGFGQVVEAFAASNHSVLLTLAEFVGDNSLLLLVLIVMYLSTFGDCKQETGYWARTNPIVLGIVLFIGLIIIDFPVHLGYHSQYYPIRCDFIKRVVATLFLFVELNAIRRFAKVPTLEAKQHIAIYCCICLVATAPFISLDAITNKVPFRVYNDWYMGNLEEFSENSNTIITTLKNGSGKDVTIELDKYDTLGYMKGCDLAKDSNYWVNVAMAKYYGCKSVSFGVKNQ